MIKQRKLEAFRDKGGFQAKEFRCLGVKQLAAGLIEQIQPSLEEADLQPVDAPMYGDGVALVASTRQHGRGPEIIHSSQMRFPVARNCPLKNGSQHCIRPDLAVKRIHEQTDLVLGNFWR